MDLELKEKLIFEKYIPGINKLNDDDMSDALRSSSEATMYQINAELQQSCGKGQDVLTMNELCRAERSICDYPDLLSYDIPHWQYQHHHFKNFNHVDEVRSEQLAAATEEPIYYSKAPEGYISQYNGEWMRLFIGNKFYYGNLYSAVHFILQLVETIVEGWITQRYPYQLQMNSYLCDTKTPCYTVDFTTSNDLNEAQSHKALALYYDFRNDLEPKLNKHLNKQTPATYIIYGVDYEGCPTVQLICKNDQTLSLIRPATFMQDFMPKTQNPAYLDYLASQYAKQATDTLLAHGL
ncbi:hypothetical protein L2755_19920 [Shewanella abyssi]|uniref:hypothetical protein n=1 Tax=Shewanella abyssi TaxID=311789 RepID=UPI00200EFC03|nr:hypothetical protein [Shewanella abyssi]MCL1051875.1 hypothetical protein [Shewanella abyssi]